MVASLIVNLDLCYIIRKQRGRRTMAHLKNPRIGYESQLFGGALLYKIAFLSEPLYIVDDIGTDYTCTIFIENERDDGYTELIPKSTFAIQLKKEKETTQRIIDLTKHLTYLEQLETPFYIGLENLEETKIQIFSGEFLVPFFAFKNIPQELKAKLCEKEEIPPDYGDWCHKISGDEEKYVIPFPKIAEISGTMGEDELRDQSRKISNECLIVLNNIASYKMKKFLFQEPIHNKQLFFTNTNWDPYLLKNFIEPLSIIFFHLEFMQSHGFDRKQDFFIFESIYKQLLTLFQNGEIPVILKETYENCKKRFSI